MTFTEPDVITINNSYTTTTTFKFDRYQIILVLLAKKWCVLVATFQKKVNLA